VILDAAGRCLVYGSGDYRLILHDALGNLIWDIVATTLVSSAMAPVVAAATIEDAVDLLGINDLIAVEAAARSAADSTEQTARIAGDNTLTTNLAAEVTRAEAEETSLQAQITALSGGGGTINTVQGGTGNASSGHVRITYPTPYTTALSCVAVADGTGYTSISILLSFDNTGADIYVVTSANAPASCDVDWIAVGIL
jgi:hypothetical protein